MFSARKIKSEPDGLADQLRGETMLTPALIRQVVADACTRLPVHWRAPEKRPRSTGWLRLVPGVTPRLL